ncbi:uncharacterized protein LOC125488830 [Plutella xylostella]|uniref:uncharacterized protein LOC125488830 n=1 Tax=Plutella xylostella TaxID=51655 RepID=UPI00203279BD|nr:uncharacterized protein LOC125488830 [Plutella xylostella]
MSDNPDTQPPQERAPAPPPPPTSEVGSEDATPRASHHDTNDEKWQKLLEKQNRNFLTLVRAMKTPSSSTELRLPDLNPSKSDVDALSWMSTADLCVNDENLQGARLMVALSRALKAKTAVTGFHCQGQGHFASSCPKRRRQDQDAASGRASGSGAAKEKRVDLCVVSAPAGMLH